MIMHKPFSLKKHQKFFVYIGFLIMLSGILFEAPEVLLGFDLKFFPLLTVLSGLLLSYCGFWGDFETDQ